MKIAVTSTGDSIESHMDARFGRCAFFAIIEIENGKIKSSDFIENEAATQSGGAGLVAARKIGDLNIQKVITGNVGPNAFNVLNQLNVEVFRAEGTIKEVVEKFLENAGPSHFGMNQ